MMDRRRFLTILSSTVAALGSANVLAVQKAAALGTMQKAYTFFNRDESAFIQAAVARIIPADDLGPGALEADVPYFIDQQLAGDYGAGARFYNQGPFGATTPYQGYQLPLSPRELYRVGISATNRYCRETYGKDFAKLQAAQQDEVLQGLQGVALLEDAPGATFFSHLLTDAKDGFFADPAYGGNKDMVGWKLVGFPGVPAEYTELIQLHNEPYDVEPVDLGGMQHAGLHHEHLHAEHRPAASPRRTTAPPMRRADPDEPYDWKSGPRFSV
ncbi:MAG: gluconate 2-dehydrogenase subunit 3 family protein [Candidatus Tectomicrobia bacterium]|nr:gluconate 2-dehydrogenase subunit 3 family protein [Candidatus Tectomicrobia bacterium]